MSETRRRSLTRNQTLALVAAVLGAVAVLGNPYRGHVVKLDTQELAAIVEAEVDHVTAVELADWIIQGRTDYRLVDLRHEASFAEYHIPTAEHVPIGQLPDYPLLRNEKIVLYSGGGIHSAQAWLLLRAQEFRGVYMLLGGLDAWRDEILFPALPAGATGEQTAEFERVAEVSRYFGGAPSRGVEPGLERTEVELPKVEMPSRPVVPTRPKKKKEGC